MNPLLREHGFDELVEAQCGWLLCEDDGSARVAAGNLLSAAADRLSEGVDAERGIAWHAADSLALRDFLGIALDQAPSDHSTISRTRRLIALETHRAVLTWILQCLSTAARLVKGKAIGIDATTLEANAAWWRIVRRERGRQSRLALLF